MNLKINIMKHIFYFIGIIYIIHQLLWLLNPQERVNESKEYKDEQEKHKRKELNEFSERYKHLLKTRGLMSLVYTLWLLCGMLTFNWVAFFIKLFFNLVIIAPISKLTQYNLAYTCIHWVNSLIGLLFGVFVIINSYHLKIDLYNLIASYFIK